MIDSIIYTWGTYQLADDNTLGTVNNEGAGICH
jgi:hypothetical protein